MAIRSAALITVLSLALCSSLPALADDELGTVVVTATRQHQRANELLADVSIVSREDIEQAGQTTLNELLARRGLPALDAAQYQASFTFPVKEFYRAVGFDFRREPFETPAAANRAAVEASNHSK